MPSLAQILAPNEREYFDLFEQAGANIVRAAGLLDEMLAGYPDHRELAGVIHDCEHDGDRIAHDIIQRLNHTFVTPFDREDIHELVSVLDDVVDFIDEVADTWASTRSMPRWSSLSSSPAFSPRPRGRWPKH